MLPLLSLILQLSFHRRFIKSSANSFFDLTLLVLSAAGYSENLQSLTGTVCTETKLKRLLVGDSTFVSVCINVFLLSAVVHLAINTL